MSATASKAHYYVVYDGEWKIQCDGENSEPYPRRSDAFKDAVGLAHLDVRNGRDVDVIVQCERRRLSPGVGFDPRLLPAAAGARALNTRNACDSCQLSQHGSGRRGLA